VAIVADARLTEPIPATGDPVHCDWEQEGDRLWAQARWTQSFASLS
jgi:hypothetical protein